MDTYWTPVRPADDFVSAFWNHKRRGLNSKYAFMASMARYMPEGSPEREKHMTRFNRIYGK